MQRLVLFRSILSKLGKVGGCIYMCLFVKLLDIVDHVCACDEVILGFCDLFMGKEGEFGEVVEEWDGEMSIQVWDQCLVVSPLPFCLVLTCVKSCSAAMVVM